MALYKVGDVVTIREDLKSLEGKIRFGLVRNMLDMAGKTYTIKECIEANYTPSKPFEDGCLYRLQGDTGRYSWSSEAFCETPRDSIFKEGDTVMVRKDLTVHHDYSKIPFSVTADMLQYAGKVCTIKRVDRDNYKIIRPNQDGCRYILEEDPKGYFWFSEMFIINNLTTKQNEDQLQRKEAVVSRGDKREGRTVCSRRSKIAVKRGHLSHKALTGD